MAKKKLKRNKGGEEEGEEDRGEDRDPLSHHHPPLTMSAMLSRYHIVRLVLPKRLTEGGVGSTVAGTTKAGGQGGCRGGNGGGG